MPGEDENAGADSPIPSATSLSADNDRFSGLTSPPVSALVASFQFVCRFPRLDVRQSSSPPKVSSLAACRT
jgi:hypothetical protein